jgi:hypothetical protein
MTFEPPLVGSRLRPESPRLYEVEGTDSACRPPATQPQRNLDPPCARRGQESAGMATDANSDATRKEVHGLLPPPENCSLR